MAAIFEGQGGQQKRQQISLRLSPIPFILTRPGRVWEACAGRAVWRDSGLSKVTLAPVD